MLAIFGEMTPRFRRAVEVMDRMNEMVDAPPRPAGRLFQPPRDCIPAFVAKDFGIEFGPHDDVRRLALCVVVDASSPNRGQPVPELELVLDEPSPATRRGRTIAGWVAGSPWRQNDVRFF